jgi:hypothetical protein
MVNSSPRRNPTNRAAAATKEDVVLVTLLKFPRLLHRLLRALGHPKLVDFQPTAKLVRPMALQHSGLLLTGNIALIALASLIRSKFSSTILQRALGLFMKMI